MDYILESKPEGGWKWAMQAMLIAVTIQIFTTAIVFFTTSDGWENPAVEQEQVVEEIPLQLDESTQSKDISPEEYAKQEFDRLHKAHQNDERAQPKQYDTPKSNPENQQPTSSTSYSGAVSVEWTLAGRSVSFGPKPTYRCKQAGVVKVNVMVNERGEVKSATIDPSSSQIQCLMDESLAHAKKWKFNADLGKAPQTGKIVFRFAAQ